MITWKIQVLVLLSLSAQCLLVSFASHRNSTNKKWLVMLISAIYFAADWVAPYALGLISNQIDCSRSCGPCPAVTSSVLLAFWAPFLLLHLGGPSNITSLSLDENDMWLKKLVELGSNVATAALVFSQAATSNLLFPASILVLLAGTIKYAERTITLFLGRSDRLENSIATLVENTHLSQVEENLPTDLQSALGLNGANPLPYDKHGHIDLPYRSMLQLSLFFYKNFKGFIVGGVSYGPRLRKFTCDLFLKADRYDAFRMVEIELSFIHEDLHTKTALTRPIIGYTIRMVSLASIFTAFVLFYLLDKHGISKIDIGITYVLLIVALVFEIISFIMVLLSTRGVLALGCNLLEELIAEAIIHRRRWSNSFSKWNLITHCLRNPPDATNKLIDQLNMRVALEVFKINQTLISRNFNYFPQDLIFEYLCKMSKQAAENVITAKEICLGRGNSALRKYKCGDQIGWSIGGVDYANSLLRWHIATDICLRISSSRENFRLDFCEDISEYLLYILIWKPSMIAPDVDNWQPIFRHAYAEARQYFHRRSITDPTQAHQALLSELNDINPALLRGDASGSVWFDACRLAKQLENFEVSYRWNLISTVWVELLVYAAFNSEAVVHARQLGEGGEVLTVVWLLMIHLGLGKQFSEEPEPI